MQPRQQDTHYVVEPQSAAPAPAKAAPARKVAVFITHGMGQQIRFETLDNIAEGLRDRDQKAGHTNAKPVASHVKVNGTWYNRIEMSLKAGATVEAHLYEGYWAPVTEGKVTIRNVIGFLISAGRNGMRNARRGQFDRWMFGTFAKYPIPARTLMYLLVTLGVIMSLVVMNSTIGVVGAALSFLANRPSWLTDGLLGDLTTTFNLVVAYMLTAGVVLKAGTFLRKVGPLKPVRLGWSLLSTVVLGKAVLAMILAGVAIPFLFYGHARESVPSTHRFLHQLFGAADVTRFDAVFATVAKWLIVGAIVALVLFWIYSIASGVLRDLKGGPATYIVTALFLAMAAAVVALIVRFVVLFRELPPSPTAEAISAGLGWALLVGASAIVRSVLVQYIGDVAAYVQSFKLDAFSELRREIRERVMAVAQGIYSMRDARGNLEYSQVIVVGHSLGSVIAYDTLNQLLSEDRFAAPKLNVAARTPLFLTCGSPLDKIAFIFAQQGSATTEPREALVASVQPMLQDFAERPARWLNVSSVWDPISGSLSFFELPKDKGNAKAVKNVRDPEATTPLLAHTEYFDNKLVLDEMYAAL